jgi:hypothetical protein
MPDLSQLKSFTALVLVLSLLDFAVNSIYIPSVTVNLFVTVIFCMAQMVTILLQFFSWFFMLTGLNLFKQGGYSQVFLNFWHLFASTGVYVLLFIIDKSILFASMSQDKDFYEVWNYAPLVLFWSLERLAAVVHYALSIYYILRIFSDQRNLI